MSSFQWSGVDWISLVARSLLVLVAAGIGQRLSFGNRGVGALLTALLLAIGFAAWSYSVHEAVWQGFAMMGPVGQGG